MDRYDLFLENFKWLYVHFKGTYDLMKNPELFASGVEIYYKQADSLPDDKIKAFCQYVAETEKSMPLIIRWRELLGDFLYVEPEKPYVVPLDVLERNFIRLQVIMIQKFGLLLHNQKEFARIYWKLANHKREMMPNIFMNIIDDMPESEREPVKVVIYDKKMRGRREQFGKVGGYTDEERDEKTH